MAEEQPDKPAAESSGWLQWQRLRRALINPEVDEQALNRALEAAQARQDAPVLWLLGQAQSGKTSIVQALTGSKRAVIGDGFKPCTRSAQVYDFPPQTPVVRFLDTRGLGEVANDPSEDIAECEARSHQLIAVMKVTETRPAAVIDVLGKVRRRHPDWPVVIAQTCLHEAWPEPTDQHVLPYPFEREDWAQTVPESMRRLILAQRAEVEPLPGSGPVFWVPLDFTRPEDGIEPRHYGLEALWSALEEASSLGLEKRLRDDREVVDVYARSAHPQIVGYSLAAASVGALPLVDLAGVPALQARLLQVLAGLYGQRWTRRSSSEFIGLLGGGFAVGYALRMAGRSLAKLIPGWGQTAGAVWGAGASGALTYALGKTACVYLHHRSEGLTVNAEALRKTWAESLTRGKHLVEQQPGDST